jgi:hypothetical protein
VDVALPEDPEARLRCFRSALRNWQVQGYLEFKKVAQRWLLDELPDWSLRDIRKEMHKFVEDGGLVDEQVERRPEYSHYEFHYDLRFKIAERAIYFETVLIVEDADDPDDPIVLVVSVHDV